MQTRIMPRLPIETGQADSVARHQIANHECRIGDIKDQSAKNSSAHVVRVEAPGRPPSR